MKKFLSSTIHGWSIMYHFKPPEQIQVMEAWTWCNMMLSDQLHLWPYSMHPLYHACHVWRGCQGQKGTIWLSYPVVAFWSLLSPKSKHGHASFGLGWVWWVAVAVVVLKILIITIVAATPDELCEPIQAQSWNLKQQKQHACQNLNVELVNCGP